MLAFNINEVILGEETYAVTTSKSLAPSLRNVFTLVKVSETGDNCVRYGDKFRIQTEAGGKKVTHPIIIAIPPKHRSLTHAKLKIQPLSISLRNRGPKLQHPMVNLALRPQTSLRWQRSRGYLRVADPD